MILKLCYILKALIFYQNITGYNSKFLQFPGIFEKKTKNKNEIEHAMSLAPILLLRLYLLGITIC